MSFLESSSNNSKNTSSKDPNYIPPEREPSTITPSKNKWTVDLRRKGPTASPSNKSKTNISNNTSNNTTSSNNTSNRSSCTFSNDVFYTAKDELGTIKDDAKPILKLWASKSKQNLANRNSATYKSTENISLGNDRNEKDIKNVPTTKHVKARYISTSKTDLNENGITDRHQNKENEEIRKTVTSRHGRNRDSYTNGDTKDVGNRYSLQKNDIPIKRVTTKSKHINSNIVTGGINQTVIRSPVGDHSNNSTDNTSNRRAKSPEETCNDGDEVFCGINGSDLPPEKIIRGKGINKRKKNKGILEYTHLNFLKSKKTDKNHSDILSSRKSPDNANIIVGRCTTGDNQEPESRTSIDSKGVPDLKDDEIINQKVNGTVNLNGNISETNGHVDIKPNSNGLSHETDQNELDTKPGVNGHIFETNSFNISVSNSILRKDKDNYKPVRINQKFFVKSCDISLDSDGEEPENSENLQTATQSLLDNLNWDPADLKNKQIEDNTRRCTDALALAKTNLENGHSQEEKMDDHNRPPRVKTKNDWTRILSEDKPETEMSNRPYISRLTNSNSRLDDKTDTHRRLIRTSSTQIEKPTLHSRRFSGSEGSNFTDNYISRRKGSTDLEQNRNKQNTYNNYNNSNDSNDDRNNDIKTGIRTYTRSQTFDVERKRYSFGKNSDNDKSSSSPTDDFQPRSTFLRQRLKEIDNKQQQPQYQSEPRKYSLGQQNSSYDENKVDSFIKSYRERWKSEPVSTSNNNELSFESTNGIRKNSTPLTDVGRTSTHNELRRNSSSSSSSSIRSIGTPRNTSVTGKQFDTQTGGDRDMNLEFRHNNFSLNRDKVPQNIFKSPVSKQTSDNSSISRFSFSSRSNSNRSSGRSNKSVSPSSSIQSLDSNISDASLGPTIDHLKSSTLSIPSFGSITKIQPSKLSDAKELQSSFSSLRREKLKQATTNDESVAAESTVIENTDTYDGKIDEELDIMERKNSKKLSMDRKISGTKIPTSVENKPSSSTSEDKKGSFSLFRGRKNSAEKVQHGKSISSYFNFKKDKLKRDESIDQTGSPPLSPGYAPSVDSSTSFDVGKENNDINGDPPLSPLTMEGRERRGSSLKRLFHKKTLDIIGPSKSIDIDNEKKSRTSSESINEPTKIKTKMKYIEPGNDLIGISPTVKEEEPMNVSTDVSMSWFEPAKNEPVTIEPVTIEPVTIEPVTIEPVTIEPATIEPVKNEPLKNEKKSSTRVLSISTKSIKKQPSIDEPVQSIEVSAPTESEVPDKISTIDSNSTTNGLDIVQTVSKTDRRSRRRDRRNQALDTSEIDTVLVTSQKDNEITKSDTLNIVPMETNETESLFRPVPSLDLKIESIPKDNETNDTQMFDVSTPENDTFFLSPNKDDNGSSESLYASDTSVRGKSSNKERIKNRKAARLEAAERRRFLQQDSGDISLVVPSGNDSMDVDTTINGKGSSDDSPKTRHASSSNEKQSPPEVMPKKRRKQRAKRSNTECINLTKEEMEEIKAPLASQDDGIVMKRNNKRGNRPRTLTSGIDADMLSSARKMADKSADAESGGVVNENMSFAEIKKKLLEGSGKTEEKKEPEKSGSAKKREKIKRTKSTKRYKTITEGIAPRDLALAAQQAKEAAQEAGKNTIDKETLAQITASLSLASDKRKSFLVESRPGSRHQSTEDIDRLSDGDIDMKTVPKKPTLTRTKSMTTINLDMSLMKDDKDDDEPEIKPLSELKNRFLAAMAESEQKHKEKKTVIDIKREKRGDRGNRPYTICGLDDWTMDKLIDDIGPTPDNELQKENKENIELQSNNNITDKVVDSSEKTVNGDNVKTKGGLLAQDILNDLDNLDVSESELDDLLNDKNEVKVEKKVETKPDVDLSQLSDLDFIAHQSSQLSSTHVSDKRNIRPQRRHRTANNPLKALQKRDDLIDESQILNSESDKSQQKSAHPVVDAYRGLGQTGKQNPADRLLGRRADLADEAVNALKATVDFSKTKLKKMVVAPASGVGVGVIEESFKPTEITNVLIQVKGRRKVQTSIVKFSVDSLSSNDCFIVVTPKDLLCWYGAQSNVIEKSKATEVASRLFQKKEMGCKALDVVYVDQSGEVEKRIIRLLDGDASDKIDNRRVINDEEYEKGMSSAYMTYIVCERNDPPELIPLDSQCHRMPSKEILQTDSAFVFDFLDEVYVWLGRKTNSAQRQIIQKLAAEKFDEGYHRLNLDSNQSHHILGKHRAISTLTAESGPHLSRRASGAVRRGSIKPRPGVPEKSRYQIQEKEPRPEHAILCQLFEGSEWVVFKEKFCDWPDESRIIRMKGGPENVGEMIKEVSTEIVINSVDADEMVKENVPAKFVIENYDLGRGRGIPKGMDGYHVVTIDVKTWHVCENNSILLPDESFGQFHSGEGYVIRWQYKIVKVRSLRNCPDISKAGGMERCCYFFWLGNDCSVNEEGATAVMTIELDKEKGPQIRCVLGKEPAALLNIFDGSMVIHAGKRPALDIRTDYTDHSLVRLYCVRNEIPSEACLLQVPPYCESLRSRGSFVLLVCQQGEVLLWHGCRANEGTRATAEHAAKQLIGNHPEEASIAHKTELGFTVIEEGEEPDVFWQLLGGEEDYGSMLEEKTDTSALSPRLFQLESATGTFIATEIVSPSKTDLHNCPFPVLQDDLYNVDQPSVFLLDASTHIYLWFGWWAEDNDTEANNSRRRRWDTERRKAMESAVAYANALERPLHTLYAIYAGLEPESFVELFPYWVVQDDITDLQIDEGIEEGKLFKITEELEVFTKEFYTITELRATNTPQGVDPTKLEKYLSDEDFMHYFGFSKEAFYTLPGWQQVNWKKKLGLY